MNVEAALAYRDFMVSNYSDAGQESWLAGNGIALLRGYTVPPYNYVRHRAVTAESLSTVGSKARSDVGSGAGVEVGTQAG